MRRSGRTPGGRGPWRRLGAGLAVPAAGIAALAAFAGPAPFAASAATDAGSDGDALPASSGAPGVPDAPTGRAPGSALPQEASGPAYDGRFTFVRIRFGGGGRGLSGGLFGRGFRGREPPWAHDYPRAERNFALLLDEVSYVDPYREGGKVLDLDDPDLFRYPIAYIVEVGYWNPSNEEAARLGEYLRKGGFLIVDDFRGPSEFRNFAFQMNRALPGVEFTEIPDDHEIFDAFFHIEDPSALAPPTFQQFVPMYVGIFEDNDPSKRLMAVINYNNDIAEYWEYSELGYYPIDLSNEAYKFGVNYVIYAMTH